MSRDADTARMTREAIPDALGALVLMKPEYDADQGLLNADVVSLKTDFSRRMAFRVLMEGDRARNLKARINEAQVKLSLGVSADRISGRRARCVPLV